MVKKILISFCLSAVALVATAQNEPYRNPDLSPSERAWDLLKRMTLEEKISQMKNGSPAIERLGIPAYNWWNEALDRKSTRLNSSHTRPSRMPSSA